MTLGKKKTKKTTTLGPQQTAQQHYFEQMYYIYIKVIALFNARKYTKEYVP